MAGQGRRMTRKTITAADVNNEVPTPTAQPIEPERFQRAIDILFRKPSLLDQPDDYHGRFPNCHHSSSLRGDR
jgi:hypothetical protein